MMNEHNSDRVHTLLSQAPGDGIRAIVQLTDRLENAIPRMHVHISFAGDDI